jgi:hypothetical protein
VGEGKEQEATAAHISCPSGVHFKRLSFPDLRFLYCNIIGEGEAGFVKKGSHAVKRGMLVLPVSCFLCGWRFRAVENVLGRML